MYPPEEGGSLLNIHGRQYFDLSNILRTMGISYTKLLLGEYNKTLIRALKYTSKN
ncbi:MAG: hypothetical protein ACTSWY_11380 [Promethearchaeota archaeon]